tara:strand:- start:63 stop:1193 length:1131 start_codon:yes stop_codon:yes gene_type:complete
MKILIVGGAGVQVQPAIDDLLQGDEFTQIVLGDINVEAAQALVAKRNNSKLSAIRLDAFDQAGMVNIMANFDIVYNASGPYHLIGMRVLTAAIEAGKHYVDYCDDTGPTLEMLKLSDVAAEKDVCALIGMGVSPGYLNLMAKKTADRLDQVEEINIYWSISHGEPEGPAVIDHMCDILSGDARQFLNGEFTMVPSLSGAEEEVDMPTPFGRVNCAYVAHPEPSTLPLYIPGLKQVTNKYATSLDEISFYQGLAQLGLMDKTPVDVRGQMVSPRDLLVVHLMEAARQAEAAAPENLISAAILDVKGQISGNPTTIRLEIKGNMAPLTSLPASMAARMLARGEIKERGVMPPEGCASVLVIADAMNASGKVQIEERML